MSTFFTSDEHLGHANVIKFCNRPFTDLDDMTEGLIARHNAVVKPGDLVYHLGDMFWHRYGLEKALVYMDRLNGTHFYVYGNHCELMRKYEALRSRFVWVKERAKISPDKALAPYGIVLDHYAGRVWQDCHKGAWQLFGHSHGELSNTGMVDNPWYKAFDVGVDAPGNDWAPVSLEEAAARMKRKDEECGRLLYKQTVENSVIS